ncbi:twin-arginine translocase TatA/TatE family subunit [Arthrobacter liuii]|uniref:twin-arginine translocase TatA/TatE family subunit n=1 Tax=Arthrobacter liuii TaxID=1476996 RepID=UPI0016693287|nr:twin-arginine translocase TatA/TatE family subunit [Arthrobacter liuii]
MFGIDAEKLFVLLIIGILVLGPDKLPEYAAKLANLIREVRRMAAGAQEQLRDELGPEFEDVDWKKFDPRQYDPRRIIREALTDTPAFSEPGIAREEKPVSAAGSQARAERLTAGQEPPLILKRPKNPVLTLCGPPTAN